MRQYAQRGFRIEQLATEAKILYTGFLLFSLAGLLASVVYYYDLVGDAPVAGARRYYAAEPAPLATHPSTPEIEEAGPDIELPDEVVDAPAAPLMATMSRRKLLEVTHFHLFTVPVFLLIIAHLFLMCRVGTAVKIVCLSSGLLSTAAHIAAPWLVFGGGASWAWLMPVTGTWMMASMLLLTIWPGVAMWRPAPK